MYLVYQVVLEKRLLNQCLFACHINLIHFKNLSVYFFYMQCIVNILQFQIIYLIYVFQK